MVSQIWIQLAQHTSDAPLPAALRELSGRFPTATEALHCRPEAACAAGPSPTNSHNGRRTLRSYPVTCPHCRKPLICVPTREEAFSQARTTGVDSKIQGVCCLPVLRPQCWQSTQGRAAASRSQLQTPVRLGAAMSTRLSSSTRSPSRVSAFRCPCLCFSSGIRVQFGIPLLVPGKVGEVTGFFRVDAVDTRSLQRICSSATVVVAQAALRARCVSWWCSSWICGRRSLNESGARWNLPVVDECRLIARECY